MGDAGTSKTGTGGAGHSCYTRAANQAHGGARTHEFAVSRHEGLPSMLRRYARQVAHASKLMASQYGVGVYVSRVR